MPRRTASVAGLAALAATLALAPSALAADSVTEVASHLANPRGLDLDGHYVYVAEAGSAGTRCIPGEGDEGGQRCFGSTGAVTRVDLRAHKQKQITTGLPSLTFMTDIVGPSDVSFRGGSGYLTVGLGGDPDVRAAVGAGAGDLGWLLKLSRHGATRRVADIAEYEEQANPDGGEVDSNANSVDPSGGRRAVVDAGGNSLVGVGHKGRTRTLAVFPNVPATGPDGSPIPAQAVPTSVTRDGHRYLVGQLVGFPFPAGAANVWSVPLNGGTPTVVASGFTHIMDLDVGADGSLYVLQFTSDSLLAGPTPGKLIRVAPDGTRTELAAGMLTTPSGLDVAANGTAYVSDRGISPTDGRILRIRPGS